MQTRPNYLDIWATTSLTQHQSHVSCLIESPFIPSVRGQLSTVTWMFPKIEVPQKWMVYYGKPYFLMGWFGGKIHYFRKHPHANRAGKGLFKKMPSDGMTLTLEPWKVVSCGSLLTLLSLDIWKVLKPKKNTQVLQIEHHFVFYMISSFHQKFSDFYPFCYFVQILSSKSLLYTPTGSLSEIIIGPAKVFTSAVQATLGSAGRRMEDLANPLARRNSESLLSIIWWWSLAEMVILLFRFVLRNKMTTNVQRKK